MNDFYSISPHQIKEELRSLNIDWWIGGGWAIELFAGNKIREHHDMDIAILRKDQFKLKEQLPEWEFKIAVNHVLFDWGEGEVENDKHALWARKKGQEKWMTEFLLNESDDTYWIFRKNNEITFPLSGIGFTVENIPVLIPIIPLLFKSAHCNEKDNLDFDCVVDKLDPENRKLLKEWIKLFRPECKWINEL